MKKGLVISGGYLIALAPLIVLATTVYTLMLPNIYCSQARIAIAEDMPLPNPFSEQEQWEAIATSNSCFLQTQFEIIQSPPILYEVINRSDLQQAWGRDGEKLPREVALKRLQNRLLVFQLRDPSLLCIRISSENPDEAAQVANELAETYQDYRRDEGMKDARRKIDALEKGVQEQLERVEAAEEKAKKVRVELSISSNLPMNVDALTLQQLESDRFMAEKEMLEKEELLRELKDLEHSKPFDQTTIDILRQLQDMDVKLVALASEYGSNHPEVRRCLIQREALEERLHEQLEALSNRLEAERRIAKNNLESLDAVLAEIRSATIESQSDMYHPFRNAMAEFEKERYIYKQLQTKLQQEISALEASRNPVKIINIAEPNHRPVGPNLFKNVVIAMIAATVCVLTGGVLLNIGLKKSRAGT